MINEKKIVKRIEANFEGRDFVVGDLHGCYDHFMNLLDFVNFDESIDRVFSVGDLIDRGPDSFDCLGLLKEKWFYSVIGNHEDIYVKKLSSLRGVESGILNKSDVKLGDIHYIKSLEQYLSDILNMPLIYEVEHLILGKFYVVHAEINSRHFLEAGLDVESEKLELIDSSNNIELFFNYLNEKNHLSLEKTRELFWSRSMVERFFRENKKNLDIDDYSFINNQYFDKAYKVFCGHHIVPFPIHIGNQYYLDTGCFLGELGENKSTSFFEKMGNQFFSLTMLDVFSGQCFASVSSKGGQYKNIMSSNHSLYQSVGV